MTDIDTPRVGDIVHIKGKTGTVTHAGWVTGSIIKNGRATWGRVQGRIGVRISDKSVIWDHARNVTRL